MRLSLKNLAKGTLYSLAMMVVAAAIALWLAPLPQLAETRLKHWLAQQDITADFDIASLGWRDLQVQNLHIGEDDTATQLRSIHARYSLASLWQRRANHITLEGLRLTAHTTADGTLTLGGLEQILAPAPPTTAPSSAGFTLPALPFDILEIHDLELQYRTANNTSYRLQGHLTLHHDYSLQLHISHATLPLSEKESIELKNLVIERDNLNAPFNLTLEHAGHVTSGRAWFTPLQATGQFSLTRDNTRLEGTIHIHDLRQLWNMHLSGEAQLDTGTWSTRFEQPAMNFESGIIQPDMLFPILRGVVQQASGAVSLSGYFRKEPGTTTAISGAEIRFINLAATIKDIPIRGVNGTVTLSSLFPPATQAQQIVSVDEIILGLPLANGKLKMLLSPDGTAHFSPSTWEWAGGTLHTAGASLNLYSPTLPAMTLSAKELELEKLLSSLLQQGITTTGRLSGNIPLRFDTQGNALIHNGVLETKGGGVVRYQPPHDAPLQKGNSFQTDILLNALENFHYDTLRMTINSKDADVIAVAMHVRGKNPELYSGQTIELNINLTGNLLDIVQSGMNIYSLPERLQEQLIP